MKRRKNMRISMSDIEYKTLIQLSDEKDLSRPGVIRQALRLYQLVHEYNKQGKSLYFEMEGKKSEIIILQ